MVFKKERKNFKIKIILFNVLPVQREKKRKEKWAKKNILIIIKKKKKKQIWWDLHLTHVLDDMTFSISNTKEHLSLAFLSDLKK